MSNGKMKINHIMVLLLCNMVSGFPYHIKEVEKNAFVVEEIGKIQMYEDTWTLVVYVNISSYMEELNNIIHYEMELEKLCDYLKDHPSKSCDLIPEQLKLVIKDTTSLSSLLPGVQENKRKRRGLFNFIGDFQSIMFGTLSESDARFYDEQISRLAANQIQNNDLIKKQTSIMKASIAAQAEATQKQMNQSRIFQQKMVQLGGCMKQMMSKVNAEFKIIQETQQLDELITYTILRAERCKGRFLHLIQALTSKNNDVNLPVLLKPETLWAELQKINNNKHTETSLPTELNRDTLYQFYNIGKPQIGRVGQMFIIKLEIPLVNKQHFTIQKITPIPVRMAEGLFSVIIPNYDLVALSEDHQSFAEISEHEVEHCTRVPSKGLVCPDLPIYKVDAYHSCETAVLLNNTNAMTICKSKILHVQKELWIALNSKFSWIYAVNKPTLALVATDLKKKQNAELENSGIITLEPGARLETEAVKIRAPIYGNSEVELRIITGNKIPNFNFDTKQIKINIPAAPQLIKLASVEKLKKITRDLEDLEKDQEEPLLEMLRRNDKNSLTWSSMAVVVITVLAAIVLWRLGCCPTCKQMCKLCKKKETERRKPEIEIIHMHQSITKNTKTDVEDFYEIPMEKTRVSVKPPQIRPPPVPSSGRQEVIPQTINEKTGKKEEGNKIFGRLY